MTTPVTIELKSIKVDNRLSRGTYAYSAKLLVDGVHICDVGNDGNGGADRFLGPAKGLDYREASRLYDEASARVAAEYPQQNLADPGEAPNMVADSLEFLCARLVEDHLLLKAMIKDMKRNVLFFADGLPGADAKAPLKMYRIDAPKGHGPDRLIAHIRAQNPKAYILNEQSESDAAIAYRRMS